MSTPAILALCFILGSQQHQTDYCAVASQQNQTRSAACAPVAPGNSLGHGQSVPKNMQLTLRNQNMPVARVPKKGRFRW